MSDNAKLNKAKRPRPSPQAGSPRGSRAGSPIPPAARQGSVGAGPAGSGNNNNTNSRAVSPSTAAGSPAQTEGTLKYVIHISQLHYLFPLPMRRRTSLNNTSMYSTTSASIRSRDHRQYTTWRNNDHGITGEIQTTRPTGQ